jgi:hypothetical protein
MKLRTILTDEEMTVILISSELGNIDAKDLMRITDQEIQKVFNIVSYFKAPMVRISAGTKTPHDCSSVIDEWMNRITEAAIAANVTPILEITQDSYLFTPVDVASQLNKHRRWKLLYDPAQFVLRQKLDPFVKYWSLLKNFTIAIDVRDIKIGRGFKPAGFGDTRIELTIKDSLNGYSGWYIMEPSLGRRHGTSVTKEDTFQMALDAFDNILSQEQS